MTFNFIPKYPPEGKNKIRITLEMSKNWIFEDNYFYNIYAKASKKFYQYMLPSELKWRLKEHYTGISYLNKDKLVDLCLKYYTRKQCCYCKKTARTTNKPNLEFVCQEHIRR